MRTYTITMPADDEHGGKLVVRARDIVDITTMIDVLGLPLIQYKIEEFRGSDDCDMTLPADGPRLMLRLWNSGIKYRTDKLLARYRGHSSEFSILHGILCRTHAFGASEMAVLMYTFDDGAIASRLDAINNSTHLAYLASKVGS